MASEILGLFTTPDQYQLAQQQAQQAEAAKYAQLDPRAQAQYGFYRGGQQLTNAIGGALGVEDPQLKIISNRQALAKQLDQTNPNSFKLVAKMAAESGDPQFAISVADAGMKLEESLIKLEESRAATNLKNAQAQKALNWQQTQTDSTQKRQIISGLEKKLAGNPNYKPDAVELAEARWIIANESKPKSMIDQTTGQLLVIDGLNIAEAAPNLAKYLKKTGITTTASEQSPAPAGTTNVDSGDVVTSSTTSQSYVGGSQLAPGIRTISTPASAVKAKEEEEKQNTKAEEEKQAVESFDAGISAVKVLRQTIADTRKIVSPRTTGWGSYLSVIPGTDAMTLDDNTQTIKSNIALEKLKELKQQSKTGASGLGALNMKEFDAIQSVIARLNPKSANYPKDLEKVDDFFARAENLMTQQKSRAVVKVEKRAGVTPTPQPPQANDEAKIQRFIQFNTKPNQKPPTREQAIQSLRNAGVIKQ